MKAFLRAALPLLLLSQFAIAASDDSGRVEGARIVYHYVGRVSLDFSTGKGIVFGYLTHLQGLPSGTPLFSGMPSEKTALFTFSAPIQFQPLPGNGDLVGGNFAVLPILVSPGEFTIYYGAGHDWSDASSFSKGQAIAAFDRDVDQFSLLGPIGQNAASAMLRSSTAIDLNGRRFDIGRVIARGVTNVTTGPTIPLSFTTGPTFGFAGYALAVGN